MPNEDTHRFLKPQKKVFLYYDKYSKKKEILAFLNDFVPVVNPKETKKCPSLVPVIGPKILEFYF